MFAINYCVITNFPSCVIQAWVTIAPKGVSANFEINFPVCKSQIPTQSLVTVAAKLQSSARLLKKVKEITDKNELLSLFTTETQRNTLSCLSAIRAIDYVHLLEDIVYIPYFNASVYTRRYHAVPVSNSQCFQLNWF